MTMNSMILYCFIIRMILCTFAAIIQLNYCRYICLYVCLWFICPSRTFLYEDVIISDATPTVTRFIPGHLRGPVILPYFAEC